MWKGELAPSRAGSSHGDENANLHPPLRFNFIPRFVSHVREKLCVIPHGRDRQGTARWLQEVADSIEREDFGES